MAKRVFITGATGFVGCRLAERLALGTSYEVTAGIHRYTGPGLARLSRLPITFKHLDLLSKASVASAIKDVDIVIHLAYGSSGDDETKRRITVKGTENILDAAVREGVDKFIHFSTAAVHGLNPKKDVIVEADAYEKSDDVYRESKIEAEDAVRKYNEEKKLPTVIIRPPLIYGPHGYYWTTRLINEILNGAILVEGGKGIANLVYVDNLIDAVLLAMENRAADGETFFVVDDEYPTWQNVYNAYAEAIPSHPPILSKTVEEIELMRKGDYPNDLKSWLVTPFLLVPDMVKTSLKVHRVRKRVMEVPWLRFIKNCMADEKIKEMKAIDKVSGNANGSGPKQKPLRLPTNELMDLYCARSRFSNEKIKKVLGYRQKVTFSNAIALIGDWSRYQGLVS